MSKKIFFAKNQLGQISSTTKSVLCSPLGTLLSLLETIILFQYKQNQQYVITDKNVICGYKELTGIVAHVTYIYILSNNIIFANRFNM